MKALGAEVPEIFELDLLKALLAVQFHCNAAKLLELGKISVERSPRTGRARYVYLDGTLVGSIRASDGRFIPTIEGARFLLRLIPPPKLRVVVGEDAKIFVAKGRTLFCKHVVNADAEIRAGDEVFVVDLDDELVAVGRAVLSGEEICQKKVGRAVKIRRGVLERGD